MKKRLLSRLLIYIVLTAAAVFAGWRMEAQSPYSVNIFKPATVMTATSQTSTAIPLGTAATVPKSGSYAGGNIQLTGSSLTTATFGVTVSSDNGATYFAVPICTVAATPICATTQTATASAIFTINLAGLTHIKFVTSGTFTATSISLLLTASPNAQAKNSGTGGAGGAVSSVSGTSPIVVTPTTGATVVSCPTCSTGTTPTIAHTPLVLKGDNAGNAVAATGQDEAVTAALGTSGNVIETTTPPPNVGNNNTIYGFGAGAALTFTPNTATTSAYENVIIGYLAGQHQTTQNFNVLIGSQAGNSLTGSGAPVEDGINTCIGAGSCQTLVTGGDNVYLGEDAGSGNAGAGSGNTVLGVHAGDNITTLNSSEIIGHSAMGTTGASITVSNDVVIGDGAASNASGSNSDNIIEGHQAANNFTTGIQNVYIGSAVAPQVTSGQHNVVVGYDGAPGLTTGSDNTIIGWEAMNSQIASSGSIAIGSLANSDTGSDNVEAGSFSGGSASQSDQVCLGLFSCNNMTGGSNVAVGIQANATSAGTGHNNVLLGRLAQVGPNINSAAQIGVGTNSTSSTLQFLNTQIVNAAGTIPHANLDIVSNAITSATGGSGITSVTCATAACTNLRGTYTVVGGTATTGTIFTLVWPTTTAAYVCAVTQNDTGVATAYLGLGHTVATATGMTVSAGITVIGTTFSVDYNCQP